MEIERESFIFYKSFYEAVSGLPADIRLEVFTSIIEYGLYGRQPENLKPFARGIFTLVKPVIDVNTARWQNGRKGGRKSRATQQSASKPAEATAATTYEQEVHQMEADQKFSTSICQDFNITPEEYHLRLSRFLQHCNESKATKGKDHHDSMADARSHFRYWITKAYPSARPQKPEQNSPITPEMQDGSFGAADYEEK